VFLEFPNVLAMGQGLGGTADEFLLGPDLLIAPAPEGESPFTYAVALPGPGWYDYWTGARLETAVTAELPRLERLPVFVRPGAIVVRQPLAQSTAERVSGPLEISVFPGPDCHGTLYDDDGDGYAYQSGDYLRREMSCRRSVAHITVVIGARHGRHVPTWSNLDLVVHGVTRQPGSASLNGAAINVAFDAAAGTASVRLPESAEELHVEIETH